jgi:undecaprenyl-phosphate 4-deoxy-4-formamido-L-arabinose transferase
MNNTELSIIIPVFNSENTITILCEEIISALSSFLHPFEIILVNDCSSDGSWKKIIEVSKSSKYIVGVNLRKNSGEDNAVMAGLTISKGNIIVLMDDDLQHNPKDIIKLYGECKSGYDVCFANFNIKKQSVFKNISSRINGKLMEFLLKKPKHIYLSSFKAIKRDIVNEIINFSGSFPYVNGIILTITNNLTQLNVEHFERKEGISNYNKKRMLSLFLKSLTGFSIAPLRIAIYAGFGASLFGFGLIIKYLIDYYYHRDYVQGWTSVVVLIIFFGGLILMSLGIIGEYIGRIYLSINNKPQYSIAEVIGNNED